MKRLNFILLLTWVTIVLNSSCISVETVAKKITVESGEIPPDMAKEEFYIIGVKKNRKSYDKYLEKGFANYGGKYILATKEELFSEYKDRSKYRYMLDYEIKTNKYIIGGVKETSTIYTYYIYDRITTITHSRKKGSNFFGKEIKAYVMAIEAIRRK